MRIQSLAEPRRVPILPFEKLGPLWADDVRAIYETVEVKNLISPGAVRIPILIKR